MVKSLLEACISALAAIDSALGMPDDGCNDTGKTIEAIKLLKAKSRDDDAKIKMLEDSLNSKPAANSN